MLDFRLWRRRSLGPVRIPPFPPILIMEDRSTRTLYQLSHSAASGSLALDLAEVSGPPSGKPFVQFGPQDGPFLPGNIRLYIEDGALAGEFVQRAYSLANGRVLTRKDWERTMLEITAPTGWTPGTAFTYTPVTI